MNSLFGVELPTAVNFVVAFVVVLLLIGVAAWLVRRLGATKLDATARGRQPRLAVVDSAAVDNRRKLVIIRRDNVEHLLMIGGPSDVVVESNIVRAAAAVREAAAPRNGGAEAAPRTVPAADPNPWPLQPEPAPIPAAPPIVRAERSPRIIAEEPSPRPAPAEPALVPPPLRAVRPADTLAGLAAELARPGPEQVVPAHAELAPPPAQPLAPAAAAAGPPPAISPADQSLAEMAQRLEAALRRPALPRVVADGAPMRPGAAPEVRPPTRPEPRATAATPPKGGAQPKPPAPDNLEKEMANLLGGRSGKT